MFLLCASPVSEVSAAYPWVLPGDFRERLRISDLVVSGTVVDTSEAGTRVLDGTKVTAKIALVRVDRVFQGAVSTGPLQFTWFSPHMENGEGFIYSGPPLAVFQPTKRYLIFLKRTSLGWEVAMPVYALEVEIMSEPPRNALTDLSQVQLQLRYESLAEELETTALSQPVPPPGMTGMAATTFPAVFDLLGGCAEPFYRHFLSSPSPELQKEAAHWLEVVRSRQLGCEKASRLGVKLE
jgi:hypothetical protein